MQSTIKRPNLSELFPRRRLISVFFLTDPALLRWRVAITNIYEQISNYSHFYHLLSSYSFLKNLSGCSPKKNKNNPSDF